MKIRGPILDARADISKIAGLTERNSASHNSAALHNAILSSANVAIIATDKKGLIKTFNAGAERMLGYSAAEAVNKLSPCDFRDPEEDTALETIIVPGLGRVNSNTLEGAEDQSQIAYIRKDGSQLIVLESIALLRDDDENFIGYVLMDTDPSAQLQGRPSRLLQTDVNRRYHELERVANELDESENLFRQLATQIPEAIWIQDLGTKALLYINPNWERLTGRPLGAGDEIKKLREAFHPDDLSQVLDAEKEFPNGGANFECRISRPDGTTRWVHVRTFPIVDLEGKARWAAGILEDITGRKEEGAEAERLKDEFVSVVSHELRTPLTSIAGSLGLLMGNVAGRLPEPAVRLIEIARFNSQRLVRLIGDILDIERFEAGKVAYDLKRVDVGPLVQQAIDGISGFAHSFDVEIHVDDVSVSAEVCADPDRLLQVFTNLLSNAIKFSPAGAQVIVLIERRRKKVCISVRDYGSGIPENFKQHIFKKFAQADNADSRRLVGTGLGLCIAQQIVTRLDGKLTFEDAFGGGTVFCVELPDWDYLGQTSCNAEANGAHILLCEDDSDVAIILCKRLWEAGFATDLARTGSEAVEHAASTKYAAILVDLHLPDGDCISLIKQLRSQPQLYNTLLVLTSADPTRTEDDAKASAVLNILDWLDKPVETDRLLRVLERIAPRDGARPRVLHVDDDVKMIRAVAETLHSSAEVMSVDSLDKARRALAANQFDVAVLNVALGSGSGLGLLLELRDLKGDAIPVIVFSASGADSEFAIRIHAELTRSKASIDSVVASLRRYLTGNHEPIDAGKDAA